jgi:outer membrane protein assembly factor BamD
MLYALIVMSILSGCATTSESSCATQVSYFSAHESLLNGYFRSAIDELEQVRICGTQSAYISQAHLELIYAYIQDHQLDKAMALANSFISFYPHHENLDYVLYLKAIYYFNYNRNSLLSYFVDDLSDRNIATLQQSYQDLTTFLHRFPHSTYTFDAHKKLTYLRELIAGYQLNIATYYLKRGAFVAALKRANTVITKYTNTPYRQDALYVMRDSYISLGIDDLANQIENIITLNQ